MTNNKFKIRFNGEWRELGEGDKVECRFSLKPFGYKEKPRTVVVTIKEMQNEGGFLGESAENMGITENGKARPNDKIWTFFTEDIVRIL